MKVRYVHPLGCADSFKIHGKAHLFLPDYVNGTLKQCHYSCGSISLPDKKIFCFPGTFIESARPLL